MDQLTRKLMTMHKALHPRDDFQTLYISWHEGGKGLSNIKDSVDVSIQWLLQVDQRRTQKINQNTRKLRTIHKALHPRDDVDRLYVLRKGKKWHARIEDSVDASIQRFEEYIHKRRQRLITATRNKTENMRTNRTTITRKWKWGEN